MIYRGKPVSSGIAIAPARVYKPFCPTIVCEPIEAADIPNMLEHYKTTKEKAFAELANVEQALSATDPDKAAIVASQGDMLCDEVVESEIIRLIESELRHPDYAIDVVFNRFADKFAASKSKVIQERASDLMDIKKRLLRCFHGEPEVDLSNLGEPCVLIAEDLFPSDTVRLDRKNVVGIATEKGGATCHTAIIARSFGIPAVLGIGSFIDAVENGQNVILDASDGKLITAPDDAEIERYTALAARINAENEALDQYITISADTTDNHHTDVMLNIGTVSDEELEAAGYADGCGLFRTEFLYLSSSELPGEEAQFAAYKRAAEAFDGKPVVLRTLDIGGDKPLPGIKIAREDNPFLGVRGIRFCFENKEIFMTQLRAALRASAFGNIQIMFPMIGSIDDIREANKMLAQAKQDLTSAGVEFNPNIKTGIMIEVPSIALVADAAAEEVDFASIGTNDLCQYLTAADRMNPKVERYHQGYHPALFRTIGSVAQAFGKRGKKIGVCGELAGDCYAAPCLIGLGVTSLSMSKNAIGAVKRSITTTSFRSMQNLAQSALQCATESEVFKLVHQQALGEE